MPIRRSEGTCSAPTTTPATSAPSATPTIVPNRRGSAITRRRRRGRRGVGVAISLPGCYGDGGSSQVRSRGVTGIDWLIVCIVLLLALFGWAQGFLAGALALAGFAVGAWLGTRVGPLVLHGGRQSPWAPAFGLIGALVAGAVLALGFEGLGARLRARLRNPAVTAADGLLGAVLTGCVGLGMAWVLGALALANGGEARREVQQ